MKILYIVHNHARIRPGGAEIHAEQLHAAINAQGDAQALLLARMGPPITPGPRLREGTLTSAANGAASEYLFFTDGTYDAFMGTFEWKGQLTTYLRDFLRQVRPDIVHFHHLMHIGYDAIREVKTSLPAAGIVVTLHDYLPICYRDGQLLRTGSNERCLQESPRECHGCFPLRSPQEFFLRRQFVRSNFAYVDRFICPSRFCHDRFVAWGLEPERMMVEECGYPGTRPPVSRSSDGPPRHVGFFGQMTPYKGIPVLLHAMEMLKARGADLHVWIYGANLDLQAAAFQEEVQRLLGRCSTNVTFTDGYTREELPLLMDQIDWVVVPSIWWENSPLVIQEAFAHGRPVICSDVGGMAEKVRHEVDGLHFRAGDPARLADTLERCASDSALWARLRQGIRPPYSIADSARRMLELYRNILHRKRVASL
jgi:glycosyltransferase involved in cell wall biosynthesis